LHPLSLRALPIQLNPPDTIHHVSMFFFLRPSESRILGLRKRPTTINQSKALAGSQRLAPGSKLSRPSPESMERLALATQSQSLEKSLVQLLLDPDVPP